MSKLHKNYIEDGKNIITGSNAGLEYVMPNYNNVKEQLDLENYIVVAEEILEDEVGHTSCCKKAIKKEYIKYLLAYLAANLFGILFMGGDLGNDILITSSLAFVSLCTGGMMLSSYKDTKQHFDAIELFYEFTRFKLEEFKKEKKTLENSREIVEGRHINLNNGMRTVNLDWQKALNLKHDVSVAAAAYVHTKKLLIKEYLKSGFLPELLLSTENKEVQSYFNEIANMNIEKEEKVIRARKKSKKS